MRIETVGIVGAGTMGGGIAINLAQHGFRVLLTDARPEAARAAVAAAAGFYARAVEKGRMTATEAAAAAGSAWSTGWQALRRAELVIEAVFEDFDLKARLLERAVAAAAPPTRWSRPTRAACGSATSRAHMGGPSGFWACTISARPRSTRSSRWSRAMAPADGDDRARRSASARPAASSPCAAATPTASPSIASSAPTPTRRRAPSMTGWARPARSTVVARRCWVPPPARSR